ncbi:MAG: hypothetical protein PUI84_02290 [Bacteroidales bacterium]|nr:hypothetical protein [Porphyromonas sp.]MDD6934139.1 hypothetical protein [Bacteroidales bacterium]MDY3101711.1 hypothetical protein [Porphyromonas sp.]
MNSKTLTIALLIGFLLFFSCGKKSNSQQTNGTNQETLSDTLRLEFPTSEGTTHYEVILHEGKVTLHLPLELRKEVSTRTTLFLPEEIVKPSTDDLYPVTHLAESCVEIFIGDVGQDTNPMLCMRLHDGRVQILNIIEAILYRDFSASAPLKGFQNIESFSSQVVDNTYMAIFAKERSGKELEVKPFMGKHHLHYPILDEVGNPHLVIVLTSDYKIHLLQDRWEGSWGQIYQGTFEGPDWLEEGETGDYTYTLRYAMREDGEGTMGIEIKEPGSFTLTPQDDMEKIIKLTSADIADICDVDETQNYR